MISKKIFKLALPALRMNMSTDAHTAAQQVTAAAASSGRRVVGQDINGVRGRATPFSRAETVRARIDRTYEAFPRGGVISHEGGYGGGPSLK